MSKSPTSLQRVLTALSGFLIAAAILSRCCPRTQEYPLPAYTIHDKQFLIDASAFDQTQVQTGQMAATRGATPDVRPYGATTAQKYHDAMQKLSSLADSLQIPLSQGPDSIQINSIATLKGTAFDIAYIANEVTDHRQAIDIFQSQLNYGSNTSVKAYANEYLPLLQRFLAWVDSLSKRSIE